MEVPSTFTPPTIKLLYSYYDRDAVTHLTLEGFEGSSAVLLSYDVTGVPRSAAVRVCRIVFGRTRVAVDGRMREEKGFIHRPGVVWVGQSVLVLPARDADELSGRLRALGVRVAMGPVSIARETLGRFRRPS